MHVDPATRRAGDDRPLQPVAPRRGEVLRDAGPQLLRLDQRDLVYVAPLVQRLPLERLADELLEMRHRIPRRVGACPRPSPTARSAARGRARGRAAPSPHARRARCRGSARRSRRGRRGPPWRCRVRTWRSWASTSAARSPTPSSLEDGRLRTAKVPTAARQEESVLAAARAVGRGRLDRALRARDDGRDERAARAARRAHGLRRQRRLRAPAPPAPPDARASLPPLRRAPGAARAARALPRRPRPARARGELEPLDLDSLPDLGDAEAVAVCLLFAFRDAAHERAVADGAAAAASRRPRRRLARGRARVPGVRARLDHRRGRLPRAGRGALPARARGGGARGGAAGAARHALLRRRRSRRRRRRRIRRDLLVSGPAGGVVGAGLLARRAGFENAIAFDMGGTSTDVCLLPGGRAGAGARARGRRLPGPAADASTCTPSAPAAARSCGATRAARCASGRSRRARDPGPGLLRARRRRHGYRREPPARPAAGTSCRAASCSTGTRRRRRSAGSIPAAVVEVVNAEMLRALRVVSVERGHDPRDFALVAFGGAGPLHACALAEELGIEAVLVPAAAGVLSALGLVGERRAARPGRLARPPARRGRGAAGRGRGRPPLPRPVVRADGPARRRSSRQRFHRAHEERYGYADRGRERRARGGPHRRRRPRARSCPSRATTRNAGPGPALLELDGSTCWIPPGWAGVRMADWDAGADAT